MPPAAVVLLTATRNAFPGPSRCALMYKFHSARCLVARVSLVFPAALTIGVVTYLRRLERPVRLD